MMDGRIYMLAHKELTGELSPAEAEELNQLRKEGGNADIASDVSLLWNVSKEYFPETDWKKEEAKANVLSQIRSTAVDQSSVVSSEAVHIPSKNNNTIRVIGAAILVSAIIAYFVFTNTPTEEVIKSDGTIEFALLNDDTKVWLDEGATLTLGDFSDTDRKVALQGNAVFDVSHDPDKKFIIDLGKNVYAEVLGTSFKASSTHSSSVAEVAVRDGKVRLFAEGSDQMLILTEGETGYIDLANKSANRITTEGPVMIGDVSDLSVNDLALDDLFTKMGKYYGVEINAKGATLDCTMSSPLASESKISEIFNVITELYPNLNITSKDRSAYTVKGTCH